MAIGIVKEDLVNSAIGDQAPLIRDAVSLQLSLHCVHVWNGKSYVAGACIDYITRVRGCGVLDQMDLNSGKIQPGSSKGKTRPRNLTRPITSIQNLRLSSRRFVGRAIWLRRSIDNGLGIR
jgi:hypothetical protein